MADRNPAPLKPGSLAWRLAAIQVLVVLVVAAGVAWAAIDLLETQADSQQRARVRLAGIDAKAALTRAGDDALSFARVLAERPTLRRLLQEHDNAAILPFVTQFCSTSGMDACAVLQKGQVLVSTGSVDWPQLLNAIGEQNERFMVAPQGQPAWLGSRIAMTDAPGISVVVAQVLNEPFARRLAAQDDVSIRFLSYRDFNNLPVNEFTSLHTTALADGRYAVEHIPALDLYAASHPVFSATGEGILLIETRLSSTAIDNDVSALQRRLLWVAAILAALALLGGVLLGRRITVPTQQLTAAAARLGQGDFATSIPKGGPAEIGQLAHTMDDMRRNLISLTDTLRQREVEAQAVLTGIVEGVYAVDGQRRITYINDTAARLLDIAPAEAVGRFCGDVLQPRRNADGHRPCDVNCPILQARNAESATAVEQLQTRAGDRRMVLTSAAPVNNLQVQVQVLRDETELEAVRRARDTVLANVSHEFRTPLAAQLASIELLRDGLKTRSPAQLEELVLSLERGTRRLTQLIDNLLESVRIEAGQLDIRRQSIDLVEVIDDAVITVEALLHQRGQQVTRELAEDLALQGDAVRLTQVFVNLLANASKFAPERSTIRIGATSDGHRVSAWVDDAGPGLPEGAQESVFERFSRGGAEPAPGGMGLGLSISRSIVKRHNGTLAASRTADHHTRFTLILPVEPA